MTSSAPSRLSIPAYKFEALETYRDTLRGDRSREAAAILNRSEMKNKYHHFHVNDVASELGLDRRDLVRKLNALDNAGHIKLQTLGTMVHRYRVVKPFPTAAAETTAVADRIFADLKAREDKELHGLNQVIDLITGAQCFNFGLAKHFGMELPGGATECGHCTWCLTGKAVKKPKDIINKRATTRESIAGVLAVTNVRDDPRFSARVGFGINSPRVTKWRLDKHEVFRSLQEHDFDVSCIHPLVATTQGWV